MIKKHCEILQHCLSESKSTTRTWVTTAFIEGINRCIEIYSMLQSRSNDRLLTGTNHKAEHKRFNRNMTSKKH